MQQLYRIAKRKYVRDLSGRGAYLYGGRWNEHRIHALYCSTSRPLAVLELLVHRSGGLLSLDDIMMIELAVPDDCIVDMYSATLQLLADDDVQAQELLCREAFDDISVVGVRVASAVLPQESNVILNPRSDFHKGLTIIDEYPIRVDSRLLT